MQIHLQLTNLLFKGRSEFQFSSQCKLNRTICCITEAELNIWLEGAPWSPQNFHTYIHIYIYIYIYFCIDFEVSHATLQVMLYVDMEVNGFPLKVTTR